MTASWALCTRKIDWRELERSLAAGKFGLECINLTPAPCNFVQLISIDSNLSLKTYHGSHQNVGPFLFGDSGGIGHYYLKVEDLVVSARQNQELENECACC